MSDTAPTARKVGVRWTIGDVRDRGFESLRLSIHGATRVFGPGAAYAVGVNSVPVEVARERTGDVPPGVEWLDVTGDVPAVVRERFGAGMAEGVGWKLAPLRLFPDRHEVSLDNDCILWSMPPAVREFLGAADRTLIAEDVAAYFGAFAGQCGPGARNAGLRGLPPGFDFAAAIDEVFRRQDAADGRRVSVETEVDEQGLQTAALSLDRPPLAVPLGDVSVCSPFHPHRPEVGACGAHYVGSNARHIPWDYYDRPADEWMGEFWARHRVEVARRVGVALRGMRH